MADESGFSFITVGAAEEEDVVIQAGIVEPEAVKPQVEAVESEPTASMEESVAVSEEAPVQQAAQQVAPKQDKKAKLEEAFGAKNAASKSAPALTPKPTPQPSLKSKEEYEETATLADLDANEPMPGVRLIMIGAALIALAAFLVYFNFFM